MTGKKAELQLNGRELGDGDYTSLTDFVRQVYNDTPKSMWFDERPTEEQLKDLFNAKINGIRSGTVIDLVVLDGKRIIGECEIVKTVRGFGYVGILVSEKYRGMGVASGLLARAMERAKELGINVIQAEVVDVNNPALKFFNKHGFKQASKPKAVTIGNKTVDVVLLERKV